MNSRQILEEYLLKDKKVTLEFSSPAELQVFKSSLYSYKSRMNKQLAALVGEGEDILSSRSILTTITNHSPLTVSFHLGKRESELQFKIIKVE
jgi:hypothetical protein